ncbi:hypothetical protein [Streptomyces zagrosensis]|uniref:SH3 domain-containing protein n=1 Tax=Streptomyces zagrosensis TaxID=1042984 RepID=A0A7W9Q6M7_9ACTN|nr:hypothetical protein [Streptomyces zagrosensis]MBB5934506.1 hypothetical protein [Streptomyces zagrosensis]
MTTRTRRARATAAALALGVAAGGVAFGMSATSAQAASPAKAAAPAKPYGTVNTISGKELVVRMYPSIDSSPVGVLSNKAQFGIDCKVRAQNIESDVVWYKLRGKEQWVTGKWSDATGTVKNCDQVFPKKFRTPSNAVG